MIKVIGITITWLFLNIISYVFWQEIGLVFCNISIIIILGGRVSYKLLKKYVEKI